MPERSTVVQTIQVGPEVAYGTPVAATKKLQSVTLDFQGEGNVDTFRPSGNKYVTLAAQGREWSTARLGGRATYTELGYLLAAHVDAPDIAQQGGTAAYQWTFTPDPESEDAPKSFTLEQGSALRSHRFAGLVIPELGYNLTRERFEITGSALAQAIADNVALTGALPPLPLVPILPKQCSVYADALPGNIGNTKLTRVHRVEWSQGNRFLPEWVIDAAQTSYAAILEGEPSPTLRLVMQANAVGMGYLTQFRSGDKVYLRLKAEGATIAGIYKYTLIHDVCGVISEPWRFQDEDGAWLIAWAFRAADDDTLTYPYRFQLINTLTALT
jgi:hypothetical protein